MNEPRVSAVNEWKAIREQIESVTKEGTWLFRGESCLFDNMFAKLDRETTKTNRSYKIRDLLDIEREVMSTFFVKAAGSNTGIEAAFFDNWDSIQALMRHYGGPTRLLDWTHDWRVAAFWASIDNPDLPGRIFAFNKDAHKGVVKQQYRIAQTRLNAPIRFKNGMPIAHIHDTTFVDTCPEFVDTFEPTTKFPRLVVQQGMFTYASRPQADHWHLIKRMLANSPKNIGR